MPTYYIILDINDFYTYNLVNLEKKICLYLMKIQVTRDHILVILRNKLIIINIDLIYLIIIMINIILIFFILLLFFIININYDTFKNKDILIIEFIGGLGNQLFFLATAFEYAQKNKKHIIIKNKKSISSYGKNKEFNKIIYRNFDIKDINIKNFNKIDEINLNKNIQGNVYLSTKYYYQNYKYFINSRKEFITKIYFCNKNTKNSLLKKYNINKNKKNICIHLRYSDAYTPEKWDGIYSEEELNKIINHCYENYKNENILIFSNDNNKNLNKFNNFKNVIFVNEEDYLE